MAKLGDGLEFKYESIIPQAPMDMKFHYWADNGDGTKKLMIHEEAAKLITDIEELKTYIEKCKDKRIAFDTETTGLTYGEDKIVGFSIALDRWSGFYVPIRHKIAHTISEMVDKLDENGNQVLTKSGRVSRVKKVTKTYTDYEHNINPKEALDVLYQILTGAKRVLMHNSEFDLNMLKFEGYDITKIRAFDNLILPYLYDPEGKGMAGLKKLEYRVLGRVVPEFKEVLGKDCENFAEVNPEEGYAYACYDKETDVLTENGWVNWQDYDGTSKLATVNLETELMEYQTPIKLYKYKYIGEMECCKSTHVDYCVTPNHNMIVARAQNPKKGWLLKRADELNSEETAMSFPKGFHSTLDFIEINGNSYEAEMMSQIAALVLADGYCRIRNKKCYTVCVATSFEKNYEEITSILKKSPFNWRPYKSSNSKKVQQWECWNKDLWEWLSPYGGYGSLNKRVPKEIFKLSKRAVQKFLRAYSITDGHNYKSGCTQYYTVSKRMKDDLQTLLLMGGKRSSVWTRQPKDYLINGRFIKKENCHPVYHIKTTSEKTTRYKKNNRFRVNYNDYVYCAEVPNHTLITRRNGSTLIAGNCYDCNGLIGVYEEMFPMVQNLLKQFKNPLVIDGEPYNVLVKDNQMVKMFVDYYGHCKILIDREKAIKYKENLEEEQRKVTKEVYDYFDRGVFNLARSKEFEEAMKAKRIYTGVLTEKGAPSWNKKAIEEMKRNIGKLKECLLHYKEISYIDNKLSKKGMGYTLATLLQLYGKDYFNITVTKNDIMLRGSKGEILDRTIFWLTVKELYKTEMKKIHILGLIQRNNSLNKALNSYVDKLTQVDECVMHYRLKGTKSGRLSSGNGSKSEKSKNHYYIDLNAQNLTKPASGYYRAERCSTDDPESILGWKFTSVPDDYALSHLEDEYIVEGQDPNITIRGCLKAPEGRYVVSLDYDAQEYKVACALSGDSVSKDLFLRGVDPHTATAYAIWGEENYDKAKRKKAKVCLGNKTFIYTSNGLKHPSQLQKEDKIIGKQGEEQSWVMTIQKGDLIEIEYDNGIIEEYTPKHKVKVWNGSDVIWKEVQNLNSDDEIIQLVGNHKNKSTQQIVEYLNVYEEGKNPTSTTSFNICSNEFAYLGGLFLGDGNITYNHLKNGKVKPSGVSYCVEPESLEEVSNLFKNLRLKVNEPKPIGKNGKIYKVLIGNLAWAKCVYDYFGHTKEKTLNEELVNLWTKEQFSYFLAGLIDSDGFLRKDRITISTTSKQIKEAISIACSALGIKVTFRDRNSRYNGKKYPYMEGALWNIPIELPILNKRKESSGNHGETLYGSWSVTKEFAKQEREVIRQSGCNWLSHDYKMWTNVVNRYCKLTANVIDATLKRDKNFPIKHNMNRLKIVKKTNKKGEVYVIETENHAYTTLCTISHNCNFCIQYGGGAPTLAESLDIPLAEAEEIIEGYERGFWQTVRWKQQEIDKMYQNGGIVFTAFGRPRNFRGWIDVIDKNREDYNNLLEKDMKERASMRVQAAVERRVPSHLIQGTCGDILRLVLYRLYKRYFKNRDSHIDFMSTVHDEINYTIDKEVTTDYVRELEQIMTFDALDKTLPITTSTDIGFTYGNMFPFVWEDETKQVLIPKRVHHA